jgi:hypothetical protein
VKERKKRRTPPPEDPADIGAAPAADATDVPDGDTAAAQPSTGEPEQSAEASQAPDAMPAAEAFAHAMAMQSHQHAAATPEDAPSTARMLPFPRPPFDMAKAWDQVVTMRGKIRELTIEHERAERAADIEKKNLKAKTDELATAHLALDRLIDRIQEEKATSGDPLMPTETVGRTPCAWEREHPGEVCAICSSGGAHDVPADDVAPVPDAIVANETEAVAGAQA